MSSHLMFGGVLVGTVWLVSVSPHELPAVGPLAGVGCAGPADGPVAVVALLPLPSMTATATASTTPRGMKPAAMRNPHRPNRLARATPGAQPLIVATWPLP